jgi:anti-anti-sigma factor
MALTVVPLSARSAPTARSTPTTTVREGGTGTLVIVRGEVNSSTAPVLSKALSRVIVKRCGDVVIDLANLEFIDSASVRVLTACKRMLDREGRRLTFRSPSRLAARVLEVFALAGLIEAPYAPRVARGRPILPNFFYPGR